MQIRFILNSHFHLYAAKTKQQYPPAWTSKLITKLANNKHEVMMQTNYWFNHFYLYYIYYITKSTEHNPNTVYATEVCIRDAIKTSPYICILKSWENEFV